MSSGVAETARTPWERREWRRALVPALAVLLVAVMAAAICVGAVRVRIADVVWLLLERLGAHTAATAPPQAAAVFWAIRLPRVLLGATVGAALSSSGAALQGVFRNPLADPTLIGVASGASLAAAACIVLVPAAVSDGGGRWWASFLVPVAAFGGGLVATQLVLRLASLRGQPTTGNTLLVGVAFNSLFLAAMGLLLFAASDAQLRSVTFWNLGSLGGASWSVLAGAAPFLVACVLGLPGHGGALNLLLLGEAEARHAGVEVRAVRRRVIVLVSLGVGAAVAVAGMIAFVGLIVPHLIRLAAGPDHRRLLPASALLGASLVVGADLVARTVIVPAELPIGVVTALLGAPFFLWLLLREQGVVA